MEKVREKCGFLYRINFSLRDMHVTNLIMYVNIILLNRSRADVPMDMDGDISEHEESGVSGTAAGQPLGEVDSNAGGVGEEQPGDGESDTELDLLAEAETESDSDDNHSNQDAASAQRSVQTGATAGSDGGMGSILLFPEDESGESSQQEDDESEAGETDEQDNEEFQIGDEQLERRR